MKEWIDNEFYELRAYMAYFINRTALNTEIDSSKVTKHSISEFDEFRSGTINNNKRDNERLVDYYTRRFLQT